MSVTERLGNFLLERSSRRSFLARATMTATALSVAPLDYLIKPGSAYGQICDCAQECDCGALCCDGYTQFCCTINNGVNACPTGTFAGGWWKADGSIYCAGPRYYIDCMGECNGCGCSEGIFCPGCDGLVCECALGDCNNRAVGCNEFRYGQCHQEIVCSGRIACRVVSCTPPWELDPTCTTVSQTDDSTANHFAPCQDGPTTYPSPTPPALPKVEDDTMFVAEEPSVGFFLVTGSGKVPIPSAGDVAGLLGVLSQPSPVVLSAHMLSLIPDLTT